MPRGNGLGFISQSLEDFYRPLHGDLANKDPIQLKPPRRVERADPADLAVDFYPVGVLVVKIRTLGQDCAVVDIAGGDYMRWAMTQALSEVLSRMTKVRVRPTDVLFCMGDVDILDVKMPTLGTDVWQFCDFRFDFKLRVASHQDAVTACHCVFTNMAAFEAEFCKALEYKFREIYILTVLSLVNKMYILTDGLKAANQLKLFEASQENDTAAIVRLLKAGADVNASAQECAYPRQLLDEDTRWLYLTLGRTPLLGAAEEGHLEAMQALLDAKADVHSQDASGFHALYLAAGVPEEAAGAASALLLEQGADAGLRNGGGYTPMHNACGCGETGAIKVLLEARADLSSKSNSGAAPVHVAALNDQPGALEMLKACGANLDMPAFGGNTPVHEGVMQNNPDIIAKLFALGADINVESGPENHYATPLRMAIDRKKKKAARKLKELGALEKVDHGLDDDELERIRGRWE